MLMCACMWWTCVMKCQPRLHSPVPLTPSSHQCIPCPEHNGLGDSGPHCGFVWLDFRPQFSCLWDDASVYLKILQLHERCEGVVTQWLLPHLSGLPLPQRHGRATGSPCLNSIPVITVFSSDFDTCYYRDILGPAPVPQPTLPVMEVVNPLPSPISGQPHTGVQVAKLSP